MACHLFRGAAKLGRSAVRQDQLVPQAGRGLSCAGREHARDRHTYLTLLALNGVHPEVMQELAGHYSSQITMDIYTHVNMDAKREAVQAVSHMFQA